MKNKFHENDAVNDLFLALEKSAKEDKQGFSKEMKERFIKELLEKLENE